VRAMAHLSQVHPSVDAAGAVWLRGHGVGKADLRKPRVSRALTARPV
jgi:hypothetical protein